MTLDFWFEFASTYSYPAAFRIEALAAARGVTVSWKPFLLGPVFNQQGWNDSPFNIYEAKGRYMWRDLQRICEEQGLELRHPSVFPRNGLLAARIACRFADESWTPDFIRAVYRANFARDQDISSRDVIESCLVEAGQHAGAVVAEAQSPASKEGLRAQTEAAMKLGLFGAPSMVVGSEIFWGNDRVEQALAWCEKSSG